MIEFNPIGTIHTPFTDTRGMPIQPAGAPGIFTIELLPEYAAGTGRRVTSSGSCGAAEAVSKPCSTNRDSKTGFSTVQSDANGKHFPSRSYRP
ncbi:MAG: hypothetical protein OEL58_01165 [Desulfobacteraceae bacterium]|nr:hypothetical protein [Desulfobacteraceae bacterium]